MNSAHIFFGYLENYFALCLYGETGKNKGKLSTSQLIMVHHENFFRSFLSLPNGLDISG
jgi:hypothetical protein